MGRVLRDLNLKEMKRKKEKDLCWHKHTSKTSIDLYSLLAHFNLY